MYLGTYRIFFNELTCKDSVMGNTKYAKVTGTISSAALKLSSSHTYHFLLVEIRQFGWIKTPLLFIQYDEIVTKLIWWNGKTTVMVKYWNNFNGEMVKWWKYQNGDMAKCKNSMCFFSFFLLPPPPPLSGRINCIIGRVYLSIYYLFPIFSTFPLLISSASCLPLPHLSYFI